MRYKRFGLFATAFALVVSSFGGVGIVPKAYAASQTCTWTGTAGDDKFSTATNWSGCNSSVPQAGDIIKFNASVITAGHDKLTNDLGVDFGGVETNWDIASGQSSATYGVYISSLSIADNGYVSTPATDYSLYNLMVGNGTTMVPIVGKGSLEIRGFSPYEYYDVAGTIRISGSDGSMVRIMPGSKVGAIDVLGGGSATIVFGDQTKDATTLNVSVPLTVEAGADAKVYFVGACAEFDAYGSSIAIGCKQNQATTFNYSGAVTLNAKTDFAIDSDATVNMTGTVTGKDNIVKASGSGPLNIGGVQVTIPAVTTTYTDVKDTEYVTIKENETATMGDGAVRSSATVEYGGVLKGTGAFRYGITVNKGGIVAPGMSPGCLTADALSLFGTYQFELGGTTACTNYDQIKLLGKNLATGQAAVDLSSSTATLSTSRYNNYTPKQGEVYTIIDNQSATAVEGTFSGLAEGATFEQNGIVFKISYKGGDGNDVTLTVMNTPKAPDTGFALLQSNPLLMAVVTGGIALLLMAVGRKLQLAKR